MNKLKIDPEVGKRLQAFINSNLFAVRSNVAKSEYWKFFSTQLQANVSGNVVEVTGGSGFYVPQQSSVLKRTVRKILRAIKQPSKAASWLGHHVGSLFETPRLMSYEKAFDAVMSHADVSVSILSPFTINHHKLARHQKAFTSTASVRQHYQAWSGYQISPSIIYHYYYQNILRGFVGENQISTVLEIGAGNGNFPSILYHDWAPIRMILVDLPETLAVTIPFLSNLFPEAKLLMPHEAQVDGLPGDFDFAFLTVDQLELLADNSIDLAINCHSFQEMTHEQIDVYFKLVQRVCRESGFFFTANRIEKIPCDQHPFTVEQLDPPNRFAEYPWNPKNEVLVHEISRLTRLVSLDGCSIRLERIHK